MEQMKVEARRKLIEQVLHLIHLIIIWLVEASVYDGEQVDRGYARLEILKEGHEAEMEPLTRDIDRLQVAKNDHMIDINVPPNKQQFIFLGTS